MKRRPILFSGEMVKAILSGRKTQTRRVIKSVLSDRFDKPRGAEDSVAGYPFVETDNGFVSAVALCPYGQSGDRLWVRETWRAVELGSGADGILYAADNAFRQIPNTRDAADLWVDAYSNGKHGTRWRPSIFMPSWASRIALEITEVRAQRLQDISEADAVAEGLVSWPSENHPEEHWGLSLTGVWETDPRLTYRRLWDSINAKRKVRRIPSYNFWVWGRDESDDPESVVVTTSQPERIQWCDTTGRGALKWRELGEHQPPADGFYDVIWETGDMPQRVHLRKVEGGYAEEMLESPYRWDANPWVWAISFIRLDS